MVLKYSQELRQLPSGMPCLIHFGTTKPGVLAKHTVIANFQQENVSKHKFATSKTI